jgi:hypothetical protein
MLTADKPNELQKKYVKLRRELTTVYRAIGDAKSQQPYDPAARRNKDPEGFRQYCLALRARQQKVDAELDAFIVSLNPDDKRDERRSLQYWLRSTSETLGRALYRKKPFIRIEEDGTEVPAFWEIDSARENRRLAESELDTYVFALMRRLE